MHDRTSAFPEHLSKDAALHEWEVALDAKGAPAYTREKDGSVSVGESAPLADDFRSGNESFLRLLDTF